MMMRTVAVEQLRNKIHECLNLFEADDMPKFWMLSGAIAAKIEEYGLHEIAVNIMRVGRESANPNDVCYLLQQADEGLSRVRE